MQVGGVDTRTLKGRTGITRAEIVSSVEQIVAAVADEHGLVEAREGLTLRSNLHDDLGMDEVDLIDVLFRAEEQYHRPDPLVRAGDVMARSLLTARCLTLLKLRYLFCRALLRPDQGDLGLFLHRQFFPCIFGILRLRQVCFLFP